MNSNLIHMYFSAKENRTTLGIALDSQYSLMFKGRNDGEYQGGKVIQEYVSYTYQNQTVIGKEIEDKCYIEENKHRPMQCRFYFFTGKLSRSYIGLSSVIALPFTFIDYSHSIIHLLKANRYINRLAFSLIRSLHSTRLNFGGMPDDDKVNKTESYCNVIGKGSRWDCYINGVIVQSDDRSFQFTTDNDTNYAYFNLINDYTYVPHSFFEKLIKVIFAEDIADKSCIISDSDTKTYLFCLGNHLHHFSIITLLIGHYSYSLSYNHFWQCDEGVCLLTLYENSISNDWVLGTNILDNYDLLFNYDNGTIHIFAAKGIKLIESINTKLSISFRLTLLITNAIVIVFGLTMVSYIKLYHQSRLIYVNML